MATTERLPLLYIMGTARSGSTILEILLANARDVFGAGEVTALVQDGLIDDRECSCGESFHRCEIWQEIKEKLNFDSDSLSEWAGLQKRIEWHDGFFRQFFGLVNTGDWQRYQQYNLKLLRAIQQVTGAKVIVDSSKYAGRALALSRMQEIDLCVICLTRSPAGLMAAFQKPNINEQRPKRPVAVLLYYFIALISLRLAAMRMKPGVFFLSYEEFATDPVQSLTEIASRAGLDLSDVCTSLSDAGAFNVGHIVTGNRVRKQGAVTFRATADVAKIKTPVQQILVYLMNSWKKLLGF